MAALQPDAVAYPGSTSKTLVPAVRIGWMVLPRHHRQAVGRVLADDRTGPSTVDQRALALLMADGGYDRHVRRARRSYRTRRAALIEALSSTAPQVRVRGIDAGLHLLLDVGSADERGLVAGLHCRGLQVRAAGDCRLESAEPSGLLVGYGNLPEHRIPAVARAIAAALAGPDPGPAVWQVRGMTEAARPRADRVRRWDLAHPGPLVHQPAYRVS